MQRPPAGGDQTPRQTDARCPNAPTFTGRDCHLQSSRNVVTLIRRAHAASAVPLHPSVTRIPHCAPSSFFLFIGVYHFEIQYLCDYLSSVAAVRENRSPQTLPERSRPRGPRPLGTGGRAHLLALFLIHGSNMQHVKSKRKNQKSKLPQTLKLFQSETFRHLT